MANKAQAKLNFKKGVYGQNWKRLREKKGKTVREFAKDINISYSLISKIENEISSPTIEQVNIYQEYFNVSLDYLVGLTDKPTPEAKALCRYTGLSEDAIDMLHLFRNSVDVVNALFDNEEFYFLIGYIDRAREEIKELDNKIEETENELDNISEEDNDENNNRLSIIKKLEEFKTERDFIYWKFSKSIEKVFLTYLEE